MKVNDTEEIFELKTTRNNLYARRWKALSSKAIVCIIHGFGEHSNRFNHVANYFNTQNITAYGIDLPGHGNSSGKRGNVQSLNDMMLAIDALYQHVILENPNIPIFLYGHSMGGGLVLRYLTITKKQPAGALITSPWLQLVNPPKAWQTILGNMALVLGLNFPQETTLIPEHLSRDPAVGKAYENDPLVHSKMTPRLFFAMRDNGAFLLRNDMVFGTKILLVHGTGDQITSYKASEKLAQKHPDTIELKLWNDLQHETHNELNKEEVLAFNASWILERINQMVS